MNAGELGDALYLKNEEIGVIQAQLKELELEKRDIEAKLLDAMQAAGTDIVRGSKATVSKSEILRAQIVDYEKLQKFVLRRKALELFERRISSKVYSELKSALGGKPIPGLVDFTQTRLNVRALTTR